MIVAEIFNFILMYGPVTVEDVARGTAWESIAAGEAVTALLAYGFLVQKGSRGDSPLYDLPIVNIEGE